MHCCAFRFLAELLLWTSLRIPLLAIVLVVGCIGNSSLQKRISSTVTAFWGLCTAIALSEGATCCFKMYIARRRPNFYALCGFDLVLRACTASTEHIREAQCSFPSGHSSLAAVSMVYLSWYLTLRILPSNSMSSRWQTLGSLSISIILPGYAVFVGATRLADNWHHFSDVLAGLVLGSIVATIVYFHFQPSLFQCSQFDKE